MAHRSPIWTVSKEELLARIKDAITIRDVLVSFGLNPTGGTPYYTLRARCRHEGFDLAALHKDARCSRLRLEDALVKNSPHTRGAIKRKLLSTGLLVERCAVCGRKPVWQGKPLVLVLDHINGINNDYRLENLRLLCPNCNSQTETFTGRNTRKLAIVPVAKLSKV